MSYVPTDNSQNNRYVKKRGFFTCGTVMQFLTELTGTFLTTKLYNYTTFLCLVNSMQIVKHIIRIVFMVKFYKCYINFSPKKQGITHQCRGKNNKKYYERCNIRGKKE